MKKNKRLALQYIKGFTLIELLVVVAIIGILMTVVFVSINETRIRSAKAAFKSETSHLVYQVSVACTGATNGSVILPAIPALSMTNTPTPTPTCTGNGTFSFVVKSKDSNSGTCNTMDSIVSQNGVTYPAGC